MREKKRHYFSFKYRKAVHYILLTSVIFLQLLLLLILYNEIFNEPKLQELKAELHISEQAQHFSDLTKDDYIAAQYNLQNYLQTKNDIYLDAYNNALDNLNKNIQSLAKVTGKSDLFLLHLDKVNKEKVLDKPLIKKIDSLRKIEILPTPSFKDDVAKLKIIKYNDILDSINVETTVSIDSVKQKGLLSRLSNAITGKVDIQKEKSNVVLTLRKGNTISSGNISEQLDYIFKATNDYYQNEFKNYKSKYIKFREESKKSEDKFFNTNKDLLIYSNLLLKKYNNALVSFTNDARNKFQEQYDINKKIRYYVVILLFFVLILISIILIFITRLTFAYEKRLIEAGKKIEQNLNFKNRIVGMISHEIRSPLNIISIYSKGIRNQVKDQAIQDSLKSIEFTTHSLSLLANQILDFSKKENKKLELNKTIFNLKTELEGIFTSLSSFVENNDNVLVVNNSIKNDILVHTDVVKIHQLFYNIVGNANKFTRKGKISLTIETTNKQDTQLELMVEVKDNGIGINENDLKLIFDSYHQGKISDNLKNLGAGLGLNLCKEIVELFSGKIKVTSIPNVETVVFFNLILDLPNLTKSL